MFCGASGERDGKSGTRVCQSVCVSVRRCAWSDGDVRIRNELTGAWLMDVAGGSLCLQPTQQSRRIHTNRLTCRSWWRPKPRSPSFIHLSTSSECLLYSWSDVTKRYVAFSLLRILYIRWNDYTLIKRVVSAIVSLNEFTFLTPLSIIKAIEL